MKFSRVEGFDQKMFLLRAVLKNRVLDFRIVAAVAILKSAGVYIYIEEDQLSKGCQANEIPAFGRGKSTNTG